MVRCSLAEWQNLVEQAPYYLSELQANGISNAGYRFLRFAKAAAMDALQNNEMHWHAVPKSHAPRLML